MTDASHETHGRRAGPPIAAQYAAFAHDLRYEDIPDRVRERAKLLILDSVGIAIASTRYEFARRMLDGIRSMAGPGECSVIGMSERMPLRDAATMNAALVHGLDYDDTHMKSVVHATAATLPTALSVADSLDASGRDMLAAYILGLETAIRIGEAARFGFHRNGYHATGVVGHFASALIAGKLMGLTPEQLAMAQGVVVSTAMASQEFAEDGAWNKRLHCGWAATAGITAAHMAKSGFVACGRPYEGRFGIYAMHLGAEDAAALDFDDLLSGLGARWEAEACAIKPFPTCHFTHSLADSALILRERHGLTAEDVESIRIVMPDEVLHVIAEPAAAKRRPNSDYDAKFSAQYIVGTCLAHGRFGLGDLDDAALVDPAALALADRAECEADPQSTFPTYYSGGVVVRTRDGRELTHYEPINRGAGDRALSAAEIEAKFMDNAMLVVQRDRAERVRDLVLGLDRMSGRTLARGLAG